MIRHRLMVMTDPEHLEELEHGIPLLQIRQIQVKYVKLLLSSCHGTESHYYWSNLVTLIFL